MMIAHTTADPMPVPRSDDRRWSAVPSFTAQTPAAVAATSSRPNAEVTTA